MTGNHFIPGQHVRYIGTDGPLYRVWAVLTDGRVVLTHSSEFLGSGTFYIAQPNELISEGLV